MPGIVGLITKMRPEIAQAKLLQMLSTMQHETSYVTGTWCDEALGVYFGWVARKGSFADGMPLRNEDGNLLLAFSGEEYPDPSLRDVLRGKGHSVLSEGPSYLVHLAEEEADFPRSLNGRFHGLLIDRRQRTATLFNDRYGMHRMYFSEGKDAFLFAGEAKAILAVDPTLREMDERSLAEFVTCGCALENRTLFRGIEALPIASCWVFQNAQLVNRGRYFSPQEWEDQGQLEPEAYYQQLREVFSRNLPRYFSGPEKIGLSLTGGLDTRMILAWAKLEPQSTPSYTFGGPYRECHDVKIARKVAAVCDQPYKVIPVGDAFLEKFAEYAERTVYLSDGCAAVSRAQDLYVNQIAAQIAPVRITGNYGSEILRRLRAFKPVQPAPGLFTNALLAGVEQAKDTYSSLFGKHALSFTAFRQAPWYQYGLLALEQTQLTLRSPFLDNDLVQTAFRAPRAGIVKADLFEESDECGRLIADGSAALHRIPTDRGLGGSPRWNAGLSRRILEFSFKAEYAYDYGMPQWLARADHLLAPLQLERLFLGRHKFCHYRVWYRDKLSSYVREILLDPRSLTRPYIERAALERIVQAHLSGRANYTTEIHRLLTLELQHRLFVDRH